MDLVAIEKDIDNVIADFLAEMSAISDVGPYRSSRITTPAFPILETANKEYYEYNYFERKLESALRDDVVNVIFSLLFDKANIEAEWPHKDRLLVMFNNEHFENVYPFEFRIKGKTKYIGYRYTGMSEDKLYLRRICREHKLEQIYIINWTSEIKHRRDFDVIKEITIKEFLLNYFEQAVCDLVLEKIKKAVAQANDIIGFKTIPNLSLRNLADFKNRSAEAFTAFDYEKLSYQIVNNDGKIETSKELCLSGTDNDIIAKEFIGNQYYEAFYGAKGFSKCFVTAEYLYNIFDAGNNFDYTAVICGYLKAVEQLVYELVLAELAIRPSKEVLIKRKNGKLKNYEYVKEISVKKPGTDAWHVPFLPKNEAYFDITLAPLIWLLHDHTGLWRISEEGKETVHKILLKYSQECRNDHFHKDNIDEYARVKCIRNNTILIFYLLLGACKLTNSVEANKDILGIKDRTYERLYRAITEIPRGQDRFILEKNGERIKALRLFSQERPRYTEGGTIDTSIIQFGKVDDYRVDDYESFLSSLDEDSLIVIEANSFPDKIWLVLYSGEERLVWEK